jgi:atypical protein kinase C zeta type
MTDEVEVAYRAPKLELFMLGATGWIFRVDEHLALKYARENDIQQECGMYDSLEAREHTSPFIMHTFFRQADAIFMPFMPGGCLHLRLQQNQQLNERGKCVVVLRTEPKSKVIQWSAEIASAIAYLETLDLAHGDLRPANILLDENDHAKLADFDCAVKFGTKFEGGGVGMPWAAERRTEEDPLGRNWSINGACNEQFAFGSILYTMDRGHEPHEMESEQGPALLERWWNLEYPALTDTAIDAVIKNCWEASYKSLHDLEVEMAGMHDGVVGARIERPSGAAFEKQRRYCREIYQSLHLLECCNGTSSNAAQGKRTPPNLCVERHVNPDIA